MKYYFDKKKTINVLGLADYMWDRSGVITENKDISLITPIGSFGGIDFSIACEHRAEQLAKIGKRIYVLWSGGLDSTAVFLLMREIVDKKDLVVLYTKESCEEYPGFFEKNIKDIHESNLLPMISLGTAMQNYSEKGIIITGEIGDQLFGSSLFMILKKDQLLQSWRNFNNKSFYNIPRIEEFANSAKQNIFTVAEMLWWINYTMKYQYVQLRMLLSHNNSILNKNVFHFFDTKELNDYSVSVTMEEKMPKYEVKSYKMPMRKLISKLSNDNEYAFNKLKSPSLGNIGFNNAVAIDTNWVRYYENI